MKLNPAEFPEYDNHEQVIDLEDLDPRLHGFIAIHSTKAGPALGGTRVLQYQSSEAALRDALRLSHTMTLKCAISGLRFGGGKGVLVAEPKDANFRETLLRYAHAVETLHGSFYTGEDVGLTEADVQYMLKHCQHFIGRTGQAGDPSLYASLSVLRTAEVALKHVFGNEEIAGRTFAIKGVGKTGSELARLISERGGKVWVADFLPERVQKVVASCKGVRACEVSECRRLPVDVFCPCALGGDLTISNVGEIKAKIIVGTANNQVAEESVSQMLFDAGILHVPDFIANAGGLINVADELLEGGYDRERVIRGIDALKITLDQVLQRSEQLYKPPDQIAREMAEGTLSIFGRHQHPPTTRNKISIKNVV